MMLEVELKETLLVPQLNVDNYKHANHRIYQNPGNYDIRIIEI